MRSNSELKEIKVKTVDRTLMLLEILAEEKTPLTLTRLGQLSKLSLSTIHRLMSTLCRSGFVEREKNTGCYKLGLKAFLIGNAALQSVDLRPTAIPFLSQLAQGSQAPAYLAVLSNQDVIYSDCVKTPGPFQIGVETGTPIPGCQTSSGKVLVAYAQPVAQQNLIDYYHSNRLISNREGMVEELKLIKSQGFCSEISSLGGAIREIAAPVFNHISSCVGAVSVFRLVQGEKITSMDESLVTQVKSTAIQISYAMGSRIPAI
ncbi:MAG TPA: IclR family transcriptional regulator [Bacillota bacterium]|nr:IclR family transcriptional regulator [Bacillota bacterium]